VTARDSLAEKPAPSESGRFRALSRGMRMLLTIAGALVLLAGLQLFVFPGRTDEFFAWTIDVPLTAAFLGAGYGASVALEWLAAREGLWANARIAVPSVFVFTSLTLVATLVHLDLFHLDWSIDLSTRLVTWAWIAIYVSVPVFLVVLFVGQVRMSGDDPPRALSIPKSMSLVLFVHAILLPALGAYLFVAPANAMSLWPWPLTPLTARAVGAWVFSLGVAAAHALWENDLRKVRAAAVGYAAIGVLQGIALARFPDTVAWGEPQATVYVVVLASMFGVGISALWLARDRR
jgi:hypothetical protein